jgi:hypothetical protein
MVGEATVETFDGSGTSLGVAPVNGSGPKNLTALLGSTPISAFVVQADVDLHRIGSVTYTPCQ